MEFLSDAFTNLIYRYTGLYKTFVDTEEHFFDRLEQIQNNFSKLPTFKSDLSEKGLSQGTLEYLIKAEYKTSHRSVYDDLALLSNIQPFEKIKIQSELTNKKEYMVPRIPSSVKEITFQDINFTGPLKSMSLKDNLETIKISNSSFTGFDFSSFKNLKNVEIDNCKISKKDIDDLINNNVKISISIYSLPKEIIQNFDNYKGKIKIFDTAMARHMQYKKPEKQQNLGFENPDITSNFKTNNIEHDTFSLKDINKIFEKLNEINNKIVTPSMSNEEKIMSIMAYCYADIDYVWGNFDIKTALFENKGVCQSKTKLAYVLLALNDIESEMVECNIINKDSQERKHKEKFTTDLDEDYSGNHAIIKVKNEAGQYSYFDPTNVEYGYEDIISGRTPLKQFFASKEQICDFSNAESLYLSVKERNCKDFSFPSIRKNNIFLSMAQKLMASKGVNIEDTWIKNDIEDALSGGTTIFKRIFQAIENAQNVKQLEIRTSDEWARLFANDMYKGAYVDVNSVESIKIDKGIYIMPKQLKNLQVTFPNAKIENYNFNRTHIIINTEQELDELLNSHKFDGVEIDPEKIKTLEIKCPCLVTDDILKNSGFTNIVSYSLYSLENSIDTFKQDHKNPLPVKPSPMKTTEEVI